MAVAVHLSDEPSTAAIRRAVGWILVGAGIVALGAAGTLMVEKVLLLEDPTRVPSCTIDEVLTCEAVMTSDQADAFGDIPNPLIGIAGFSALIAFGVAVIARVELPRAVWLSIQGGVTFAVGFVHWLFFQTVYRIEALCPYCMVVWVATIATFVYVTLHNVAEGRLPVPTRLQATAAMLVRYHSVILILWLLVLAVLIGQAFWEHWETVL